MARKFDPTAWVTGVTVPQVSDFTGIYTDLYSRGAVVDGGGYGRANTSYITLLPGELPGALHTITGASWSSGVATLTIGGHSITVNQRVAVAGVTPSGYNTGTDSAVVTAVDSTHISFALTANPGTYTSGGSVLVDGVTPAFGTLAVDPNLNLKLWNGSAWAAATTAANAPVWWAGSGAPSSGTGGNGDMYLRLDTGDIYGPKTAGLWGSAAVNITGPTGYSPLWRSGTTAPSSGTGNNGDMYVNTVTGDLYGPKASGSWGGIVVNIQGTGTNASSLSTGTLPAARLPGSGFFATQLLVGEAATGSQSPTGAVLEVFSGGRFLQVSGQYPTCLDWTVNGASAWAHAFRVKQVLANSQSAVFGALGNNTTNLTYAYFGVADSTNDPAGYNSSKVIKVDSTGAVTIPGTVYINNAAGTYRDIWYQSGGVARWSIYVAGDAESGSNAGSTFFIGRYTDAGAFIDNAIAIDRPTGLVTIGKVTASSYSSTVRTVTGTTDTATTTDSTLILNNTSLAESLPASPTPGQELTLCNITGSALSILGNGHNIWSSGTSASSYAIAANTSVTLQYDNGNTIWRNITPGGGSGGSSYTTGTLAVNTAGTTNLSATYNELMVEVDCTAGPVTIRLFNSVNGYKVHVKKVDASINAVTINTASGQIDDGWNPTISARRNGWSFWGDGTNWETF